MNTKASSLSLPVFVLLCAGVGSGCAKMNSSDVNPSEVYTTYDVSYRYGGAGYPVDSSTPILKLTATFNAAGSTGTYLVLDGQSNVTVNGAPMTENDDIIDQVFYTSEKDGATAADANAAYVFTYTGNDGKQYQNAVTLPPAVTATNAANSSYSLSSPLTVNWSTASSVATSETLTAYLEKTDSSYFISSQSGSASGTSGRIVIGTDTLTGATSGTALLSICRSRDGSPAQAPAAGGSISMTRCSPKIAVVLH